MNEFKHCPFCGLKCDLQMWEYITYQYVKIRCNHCSVCLPDSVTKIAYEIEEKIPEEIKDYCKPIECAQDEDGNLKIMNRVDPVMALRKFGHIDRWNARAEVMQEAPKTLGQYKKEHGITTEETMTGYAALKLEEGEERGVLDAADGSEEMVVLLNSGHLDNANTELEVLCKMAINFDLPAPPGAPSVVEILKYRIAELEQINDKLARDGVRLSRIARKKDEIIINLQKEKNSKLVIIGRKGQQIKELKEELHGKGQFELKV